MQPKENLPFLHNKFCSELFLQTHNSRAFYTFSLLWDFKVINLLNQQFPSIIGQKLEKVNSQKRLQIAILVNKTMPKKDIQKK